MFGEVPSGVALAEIIWRYATTGEDASGTIGDAGKAWIDKHLCPWPLWTDADRRKEGKQFRKISRYTLDEQNMELVPMVLVDEYNSEYNGANTDFVKSSLGSETFVCLITDICSGQSQISRYQGMMSGLDLRGH